MAKKIKKDLVPKATSNEIVVHAKGGSLGAADDIESHDIVVPRIWLMQSISALVESSNFKSGDFVHSVDEILLGNGKNSRKEEKPINFIPFALYKTMRTLENGQWIKTEDYHPAMRKLPYEEVVNGIKVNRQIALNYLGVIAEEVREMELKEGVKAAIGSPICICFKSSAGNKAAKDLATKINDLSVFRKPSWFKTFTLSCETAENDKGKFYKWTVKQGATSTEAQQKAAAMLCEQYNKNKEAFKIDDSDENVETETPVNTEEAKKNIKF